MKHFWQTSQQFSHPEFYLVREYSRTGVCVDVSDGSRRVSYLERNWDEYCSLARSKPLAQIISTFRDYFDYQ